MTRIRKRRLHRSWTEARSTTAVAFVFCACTEAPREPVVYDAVAIPSAAPSATFGGWSVRLTRADIAFGPVYFCAAASGSSTLCSSSVAELASFARIDGLSSEAQPLGRVHGFTGTIKSASYDYGISWFDTQNAPVPADIAPEGHSLHLEGKAERDGQELDFVADVDVVPQYQGQTAVATAPAFATVDSSAYVLEVHVRTIDWFRQLDFDALAAEGARSVAIAPGSPAHNALLVGIKNLAPPDFRWVRIQQ